MLNLSPLFYTTDEAQPCLLNELELNPVHRGAISEAKKDVRKRLREGIPALLLQLKRTDNPPSPRFFTQGSWAYRTLNAPVHLPPQQADIDDGCYLPMSFVSQTARPSLAATVFFEVAELVLGRLCRERGWNLHTDKPTCIRVEIAKYAHIDVPLYAIPDKEFESLTKAATREYGYLTVEEAIYKAEKDAWTAISKKSVLLAHRVDNWVESDPRPVKEWFVSQVDVRGEQLRRVVRYLKAFRDWTWKTGGPSSILLMAAASPIFERRDRRDDLALLDVLSRLPGSLREGVSNPVDASESLTDRLGKEKVEEAAVKLEELERTLRASLHASNAGQACEWMRQQFGARFPDRPDRVISTSVAATIAAAPAAAGPSELVGRTKAGS